MGDRLSRAGPTYRLLLIASSLGYYFFAGIRGFGMIYLTQHYGLARSRLSPLMILVGLGALAGIIFSGRLTGWLFDRGIIQARIIVPGCALFVSVLFIAPAIWTTSRFAGVALRRPLAIERAHGLRPRCRLLGREFVLGRAGLQVFELKLHLVEQRALRSERLP